MEVATEVDSVALAAVQLLKNLIGRSFERLGHGSEGCIGLGESLGPVEGQVEVSSAVVVLLDLTAGSSVFI